MLMLGDFWVPMINRFEGSASSDNQNFSFLDSWPTGEDLGWPRQWCGVFLLTAVWTPAHACVLLVPLWLARQGSPVSSEPDLSRRGQSKPHEDECHACGFCLPRRYQQVLETTALWLNIHPWLPLWK